MRSSARPCWLAVGLLLGCGPAPDEVVGVYQGQDGSSGPAASEGSGGGSVTSGSTGPIADGSATSGTSMPPEPSGDATTAPVDPSTTDPGTTTTDPTDSTGPAVTTVDPSSSSGEPPPPPTCDELFGAAPGYVFCSEDAGSCSFNVNPSGDTCFTICGDYGQTCIGGLDNPSGAGTECMIQGSLDCDDGSAKSSTICICSRP